MIVNLPVSDMPHGTPGRTGGAGDGGRAAPLPLCHPQVTSPPHRGKASTGYAFVVLCCASSNSRAVSFSLSFLLSSLVL